MISFFFFSPPPREASQRHNANNERPTRSWPCTAPRVCDEGLSTPCSQRQKRSPQRQRSLKASGAKQNARPKTNQKGKQDSANPAPRPHGEGTTPHGQRGRAYRSTPSGAAGRHRRPWETLDHKEGCGPTPGRRARERTRLPAPCAMSPQRRGRGRRPSRQAERDRAGPGAARTWQVGPRRIQGRPGPHLASAGLGEPTMPRKQAAAAAGSTSSPRMTPEAQRRTGASAGLVESLCAGKTAS